MPPIRVVVSGTGKMGREVLAAVSRDPGFEPVGVVEKLATEDWLPLPGGGLVPQGVDPAELLTHVRADVVIDFTNGEWAPVIARAALDAGARPVIGTTGMPPEFIEELAKRCRQKRLGAVVAPNFALGAVLLIHMARLGARFFDSAEIIELHHDQKADAPSGTSLTTARAMLESRGRAFVAPETSKETLAGTRGGALDGVAIHSVRLPGFVAHQEVIFGGQGQTLTLRHDSTGRESFMPGVLLAAREVMAREELVVGLEALIGLA